MKKKQLKKRQFMLPPALKDMDRLIVAANSDILVLRPRTSDSLDILAQRAEEASLALGIKILMIEPGTEMILLEMK